jgi:hypothetical protein
MNGILIKCQDDSTDMARYWVSDISGDKQLAPQAITSSVVTPAEPEGTGYRLTEHVKKYYRTTTL